VRDIGIITSKKKRTLAKIELEEVVMVNGKKP